MVYYEPSQPELYQGRNLDPAYHRFAHRHRVELVHAYDEPAVLARPGRFSGEDFTAVRGYEGPGQGVGNRIVPLSFYGPGRDFREKDSAWPRGRRLDELREHTPAGRAHLPLPARRALPGRSTPEVRGYAERVRSNPGPGGKLPLFLTKRIIPEFQGLIDIWSHPAPGPGPGPGRGRESARSAAASASTTAAAPRGPPSHRRPRHRGPRGGLGRVQARHRPLLLLARRALAAQQPEAGRAQAERLGATPSPSTTAASRSKPIEDQGYINGDGVLLYPGEEKLHPEEDRGLAGPVGTVQLANLRRGLQDHQYLTLARAPRAWSAR